MKNFFDSSLYFSVITEDSLMQTVVLDAVQQHAIQKLVSSADVLNVLQHPEAGSLDEYLAASRSGEDLLLSFRTHEEHPALILENFFTSSSRLHVLRQDGELLRGIVAQDNPSQGPLSFSSESVGDVAQQAEAPALAALHQAILPIEPAANVSPAADLELKITNALDQVGARQGTLESGSVTDDHWSILEGTGAADSILEIFNGSELIGEVRVGKDGHWRFEPEESLQEGGHVFTARVKGGSDTSNDFVLILDSIAPSRVIIEQISDDLTGSPIKIAKNGHTADNTPLIEGKAEAYSMVAIYNGKTLIGTSFADANGKWSLSSFFTWPDGQYSITAQAIDHSGNAGLSSTPYQFTINAAPIPAPVILQVFDDVGDQQGAIGNNAQTDDQQPTLSGSAEPNARVEILDKGTRLGEALADASGKWSFTPTQPLGEGTHSFTARSISQTGKVSESSAAWNITIDVTAPSKPGTDGEGPGLHEIGGSDGPIENGGTTNDNTPSFKGEGEPGDTIIIIDEKSGEVIGETKVDENGNWELIPNPPLEDGEHEIVVIIQDPAGNQSEKSDPIIIIVDTVIAKPSITDVIDDVGSVKGSIANNGTTDDSTPTLSGKAEAGALVVITATGKVNNKDIFTILGGAFADADGNWSFTPGALDDGQYVFTVYAEDAAGNMSSDSNSYAITIQTSTAKPTISDAFDDVGPVTGSIANNGVTDDTQPTLTGKAMAGATVTIKNGSTLLGSVVADASGNWSFTPSSALAEGKYVFTVTATDSTGKSTTSDTYTLTVDTSIAKPTIANVTDDEGSVTGNVANNGTTDDPTPTLSGKAEAGALVVITATGKVNNKDIFTILGGAFADADGNWSFTPGALDDGQYVFTVYAEDAAGNMSSDSNSYAITIQTSTAKPTISDAFDDVGPVTGSIANNGVTDDTQPTLSGKAEVGALVLITATGKVNNEDISTTLGGVYADADGNWSFTPQSPLPLGTYSLTATAINVAGTASASSEPYNITVAMQPVIYAEDTVDALTGNVPNDTTQPITTFALLNDSMETQVVFDSDTLKTTNERSPSGNAAQSAEEPFSLQAGDTLLLDGKHMALDLDALVDRITGIEKIDLGAGGSNSLSADALEGMGQADILLADGKNQLVISGDGSNNLQLLDSLSEHWMQPSQAEVGGVVDQTYISGANELLIEQSILVTLA
ncbi:Ig-like domain-containing protein [Pseudomonas citronellolis]|uniref:Ig-like domain-containing protein n=3 Tax=Pseudomonas TaxID=286 RepID=UPI00248E109C|nr:Ig-like domain-containing protein [Pseudomonas citronellolis]